MNKKYIFLGAFLIISLGLLLWLAQQVGALGARQGNHYTVRLPHAAGLVQQNAVKIAGVQVGQIQEVKVDHREAVLILSVNRDVELHEGTLAIVRAKSLLGEKYLQLDPGELDTPILQDGDEIANVRTTFEIDQALNALEPFLGGGEDSFAASLAPLAGRLDSMLASAQGADGQAPLVERENLKKTLDDAQATVQSVRRITEDNEKKIGELIDNSNAVLGDPRIPRIIANLDRVSATTAQKLPGLLEKTESTLDTLETAAKELTPERMDKVGDIIDDVAVASENLRQVSEQLKGSTKDVGPLLKSLSTIAKRAAQIDERVIRQFLQKEGVHVTLGVPKKARGRIDELE